MRRINFKSMPKSTVKLKPLTAAAKSGIKTALSGKKGGVKSGTSKGIKAALKVNSAVKKDMKAVNAWGKDTLNKLGKI